MRVHIEVLDIITAFPALIDTEGKYLTMAKNERNIKAIKMYLRLQIQRTLSLFFINFYVLVYTFVYVHFQI